MARKRQNEADCLSEMYAFGEKPLTASHLEPHAKIAAPSDPQALIDALELTGQFRVLRKVEVREIRHVALTDARLSKAKIGVIVDTETTGLDHRRDEIIELGMLMFTYNEAGICDVIDIFSALRQPIEPICREITRITGITDEMVAGKSIDPADVSRFIERAEIVIAHNARFDRPFCEKFAAGFDVKPWACSVAEVDWSSFGFEGSKLSYLVGQCGWFHSGHRAIDDCHALLAVLTNQQERCRGAFQSLINSAAKRRCRVWAHHSPFDLKDALKARGYRWNDGSDGRLKSWWKEVDDVALEAECRFLREEIYRRNFDPHVDWLTAVERYKA